MDFVIGRPFRNVILIVQINHDALQPRKSIQLSISKYLNKLQTITTEQYYCRSNRFVQADQIINILIHNII